MEAKAGPSFERNTDFLSLNVPDESGSQGGRPPKKWWTGKVAARQRARDAKARVKQRTDSRRLARNEYNRLAALSHLNPTNKKGNSEDPPSHPATKKPKNRYDVSLLPSMFEIAAQKPDFEPLKLPLEDMKDLLTTGSEKRAAKRALAEAAKEQRREAKQAEKELCNNQEDLGFVIDTVGEDLPHLEADQPEGPVKAKSPPSTSIVLVAEEPLAMNMDKTTKERKKKKDKATHEKMDSKLTPKRP